MAERLTDEEIAELAAFSDDWPTVRQAAAEVVRLRSVLSVLAELALEDLRASTHRMQAVGDVSEVIRDLIATTHLSRRQRREVLAALDRLQRVFNEELRDPKSYRAHHEEKVRGA